MENYLNPTCKDFLRVDKIKTMSLYKDIYSAIAHGLSDVDVNTEDIKLVVENILEAIKRESERKNKTQ